MLTILYTFDSHVHRITMVSGLEVFFLFTV